MADLQTEAMKAGGVPEGYSEIEVDFFQFLKEGDSIQGRLTEKRETQMKGGRVGRYTLLTKENKKVCFLGSVLLDEKLRGVGLGAEVYVVFTHTGKTGSEYDMKYFNVYVKSQRPNG